jgi:hypothetical protein
MSTIFVPATTTVPLKWEVVGGPRGAKKSPEQKKQKPVAKAPAAAPANPANQKIEHMRKYFK